MYPNVVVVERHRTNVYLVTDPHRKVRTPGCGPEDMIVGYCNGENEVRDLYPRAMKWNHDGTLMVPF